MTQFPRSWTGPAPSRMVITGLGIVSPAGRTVESFWQSLLAPVEGVPDARSPRGVADFNGHIDDFGELPDNTRKAIRKSLKLMNRETQLGVAAGQQALADSGLLCAGDDVRPSIGVCFGADNVSIMPEDFQSGVQACAGADGSLDLSRWGTAGLQEVEPLWLLKCLPNMPACHLAIINDLQGPNNTITQRDVSANMAIAEACRKIRCGDAPAMLVGATGTTLSAFNLLHARLEGELASETGDGVCLPFDRRRTGPAPGEGAAAFVIEELDSALDRGARIYGEIIGSGSAARIGADGVVACQRALTAAVEMTLRQSELSPESVGHIHAHGLGTRDSDIIEAAALRSIFGSALLNTPVVAAKGRLSHAGSGAGAVELLASILAMNHGELFAAPVPYESDPDCPVRLITEQGVAAGDTFLNLSMFGRGLASCVAVRRYAA